MHAISVFTLLSLLIITTTGCGTSANDEEEIFLNHMTYRGNTYAIAQLLIVDYTANNPDPNGARADDIGLNFVTPGLVFNPKTRCWDGEGDGLTLSINQLGSELISQMTYPFAESSDEAGVLHTAVAIFGEVGDGECNTEYGEAVLAETASFTVREFDDQQIDVVFTMTESLNNTLTMQYRGPVTVVSGY